MRNRHLLDNTRYDKEISRSCWGVLQERRCVWLIGDPVLAKGSIDFHCMGHWFDPIRVHLGQLLDVGQHGVQMSHQCFFLFWRQAQSS